jgi:hypothetical protein
VNYVMVDRPPGAQGQLESVEATVRGHLMQPDVWIRDTLRLPVLHRGGGAIYAWPPAQPNLAVEVAGMPVPRHLDGSTWWKEIEARNARMVADAANNKAATDDLARQRAREEREAAEIEAAKKRDRDDYRQRGWPPPGP